MSNPCTWLALETLCLSHSRTNDHPSTLSYRLCGYTPFRSDDPAKLAAETQRGKIEFHDRYWRNITPEAKEFVKACLTVDASKRITADEAMKHKWLVEHKDDHASHDISIGLRENYRKRWKTAINAVRASTKFRTFAALAADNKDKADGEAVQGGPGAETAQVENKAASSLPSARHRMYSDDEDASRVSEIETEEEDSDDDDDDGSGWQTPNEEEEKRRSQLSQKTEPARSPQSPDGKEGSDTPTSSHNMKERVASLGQKLQNAL